MKDWLRNVGIVLSIVGLGTASATNLIPATIIVALGIGAYHALRIGAVACAITSMCMLGASHFVEDSPGPQKQLEQTPQPQLQTAKIEDVKFTSDASPEAVREQLMRLHQGSTDGAILNLIEECTGHMDLMDKRQAQLQRLLDLNDARELKNLTAVLDDVEARICRNLRKIINLIVTADDDEFDRQLANRYIKDNVSKLEKSRELLWAARDYINEYDTTDRDKNVTIQAYIDTLREQLEQEVEK